MDTCRSLALLSRLACLGPVQEDKRHYASGLVNEPPCEVLIKGSLDVLRR